MTVDVDSINEALPNNVKAAGVDNAAIHKLDETDETTYLTNGDVHPEPGMHALISLFFEDPDKHVSLAGPVGDRQIIQFGAGTDFVFPFEAKQKKVYENEDDFSGYWKGLLQFSKFRWIVKELAESTEAAYKAAEEKVAAAAANVDTDGAKLYQEAVAAIKTGKNEEAISILTTALKTCEINEDATEEDEDPHAALRLQILTARAQAAYNLKAYRVAVRDCELIEQIYGRPIDALNALDQAEAGVYFKSILIAAQANQALGNTADAGSGYMAIMILKMIAAQKDDLVTDGEPVEDPVAADVAEELTQVASAELKKLEEEPNNTTIYRLKISLLGVEPQVFRTLDVTANTTLGELREVLTFAFGWVHTTQTHEFEVYDHGIVRFTSIPDDEFISIEDEQEDETGRHDICEDEDSTNIGMVVSKANDAFTFVYGLQKGKRTTDTWVHQIVVESVRQEVVKDCCDGHDDEDAEHDHAPEYPKVVAGARACPPESVGGPAGYQEFLKAVAGTPTDKFPDRISALNFAVENIGFSNNALDSWGGAPKRTLESMLAGVDEEKIKEIEEDDEEPKDLETGGWDAEAFNLEECNKAVAAIASLMEHGDDEDDWESDDDEEEEDI